MAKLSTKEIEEIRSIVSKLDAIQVEVNAAVKRKADEPVSKFQLQLINGVIQAANGLLGTDAPIAGFSQFDYEDIPTARDVSLVISLYVETYEKIRCSHIHKMSNGAWVWLDDYNIQTVPPRVRK